MAEPESRRLCPTRPDGAHSLIAHSISPATCLERQRRNYHKCFACLYRGLSATVVLPTLAAPAPLPPEPVAAPVPVTRKRSKPAKTA